MDLHVYRSSQDRWHDLRAASVRGAALAPNAVTLEELVRRLVPGRVAATPGQRFAVIHRAAAGRVPVRYAYDAVAELKAARVTPGVLRDAGASLLAGILEDYERQLSAAELFDPQDLRWLAPSSLVEPQAAAFAGRFDSVVLHALYDLTDSEFEMLHSLIERLPGGGTVQLFNTTANVKPTQLAEWTWRRFVQDDSLAERTFPEFLRPTGPADSLLDRLFVFDTENAREPLPAADSLRILQCPGRYGEIERIGSEVAGLIEEGVDPVDIGIVVRHIDAYGEMIEDVFSRYGIDCVFETGVPLLRIPFIKYWVAILDLVCGARSRESLARVLGSAYQEPRLTPALDPERLLAKIGYIDRRHLKASVLAARHSSPLAADLERFEGDLDSLESTVAGPRTFMQRLAPHSVLADRDLQAWQILSEEMDAIDALTGAVPFVEFLQLASGIAGLRTVDRFSGRPAPPGVSRVAVLPPAALGYRSYRWLFAPGFADGEIPGPSLTNPLLPDELLEAVNRSIRPRRVLNSRDRGRKEPLYLFLVLDSASEGVTLTCPGSTLEGEPIQPSIYIGEILRHYGAGGIERPPVRPPRESGSVLRHIATAWKEGWIDDEQARQLLGDDIGRRVAWEERGSARADLGAGALPVNVKFSPSELDALAACPFVFLARDRLKLRSEGLPDFEVPPQEIGILAHRILREFYGRPVAESEDQARACMEEVIQRQLAMVDISGQGVQSVIDPALWRIRRPQLVRALVEYVRFAVADARAGYETLLEYLDRPLPEARLGSVLLGGRPDHVAVRRGAEHMTGIRIDDFKYSAASSGVSRQLQQSLQIPVYAHLAAGALGAGPEVPVEGRYLLLRSPSTPVVAAPVDGAVLEDIRARIETLVEKIGSGHLHPDPEDRQNCDDCQYRRLCRFYGT